MRVCVGARVYSHFANLSKIVQEATRAGRNTSDQSDHQRTQEHKRPPQAPGPEHQRKHPSARAYKKKLQKQ